MSVSFLAVEDRRAGGAEVLFPGWAGPDERVCVYSPHDDDAVIGAAYAMRAALDSGAEVHVFVVCDGACGYSTPGEREGIVERRRMETLDCYGAFGIPAENVLFLGFPDFSAIQYVGRKASPVREGHFRTTVTELRRRRITRVLAPNHYHEHIDHLASFLMAAYDAPQAGDEHSGDWAEPHAVRSVAQYSVWAEMDPEDALVAGRDPGLRGNTVAIADAATENGVMEAIGRYPSQAAIISSLVDQRKGRRLPDGRFIEVYRRFDPRPKFDFGPYRKLVADVGC